MITVGRYLPPRERNCSTKQIPEGEQQKDSKSLVLVGPVFMKTKSYRHTRIERWSGECTLDRRNYYYHTSCTGIKIGQG
jgi:hypothetical protein